MAVTAILCALAPVSSVDQTLRAELTLTGQALAEVQARQAAAAGAARVLIFAATVSPAMARAVDRLLSDGINATIVRDPVALARAVGSDDRLLLVADGLVCPQEHWDAVAAAQSGTLLVTPAAPGIGATFERIDAHHLWAGLATLTPQTLSSTIDMLGDWDFQSTLLRAVVQSSTGRRAVPVGEAQEGRLAIVTSPAEAVIVSEATLTQSTPRDDESPAGFAGGLLEPLAAQTGRWLVRHQVSGATVAALPYAVGALSLLASLGGLDLLAVLVMLIALVTVAADRHVRLLTRRPLPAVWQVWLLLAFSLVLVIFLARPIGWTHGLYLAAVLAIIAHCQRHGARRFSVARWMVWTPGSALLTLLPFMLIGQRTAGFTATTLFGLASIAMLLHAASSQDER